MALCRSIPEIVESPAKSGVFHLGGSGMAMLLEA